MFVSSFWTFLSFSFWALSISAIVIAFAGGAPFGYEGPPIFGGGATGWGRFIGSGGGAPGGGPFILEGGGGMFCIGIGGLKRPGGAGTLVIEGATDFAPIFIAEIGVPWFWGALKVDGYGSS